MSVLTNTNLLPAQHYYHHHRPIPTQPNSPPQQEQTPKLTPTVPISPLATSLSLPTHPLNTFTHWTPPFSYNLVIAVSFGLLIPPRILALAPHGGLNVHPSLLPDLRGSAPIQHAILQQRPFTGVTVQTLHPTRFDAGVVLRQTGPPGLSIGKEETRAELEARLAAEGAAMLVDVLRQGLYRSPVQEGGWWQGKGEGVDAPKLTKRHHEVDFATMTLDRVRAGIRALGHVWCALPNGERLIVHEVVAADANANAEQEQEQEQEQLARVERKASMRLWYDEARDELLFRAACGSLGVITSSTYPGGKARRGNGKVASMLMKERAGL